MSCYYIIGIRLDHRTANASKLQEALTAHGCNIRTVSYTHLDGAPSARFLQALCRNLEQFDQLV